MSVEFYQLAEKKTDRWSFAPGQLDVLQKAKDKAKGSSAKATEPTTEPVPAAPNPEPAVVPATTAPPASPATPAPASSQVAPGRPAAQVAAPAVRRQAAKPVVQAKRNVVVSRLW